MIVGKLRSHQNSDIKHLASDIVSKWKKAVDEEKSRKRGSGGALASPASTPRELASPKTNGGDAPFTGNPEKRKFGTDGADIKRTGSATRDNCIGLLYNGLAFRSTEPVNAVVTKAAEVERAAFAAFKGESKEYKDKMKTLFASLKNKSNQTLGVRVLKGEIPAAEFVTMSAQELKSAELQKLEQQLEADNMKRAQVPMQEKSISDSLQCGKCKEKKVSYSQAQTRSADEPMTTFCECTVCGNRWKVSKCPLLCPPPAWLYLRLILPVFVQFS